ncbi:hypothetical protein ACFL1M_02290 [Patescibacteria group bacterium]
MAKKRRKKKQSSFKKAKNLLSKLLLLAVVFGAYYVYKNPEIISSEKNDSLQSVEQVGKDITLTSFVNEEKFSEILGKTTSLVEEGLENIKVPKQLSGTQEEIVIQDVVNNFTERVKDLPNEQVGRIKIQFCKDMLSGVENASVVEK